LLRRSGHAMDGSLAPPRKLEPAHVARGGVRAGEPAPAPATPIEVLAIGASTGGPNALADLVSAFPADLPVPVLIAQHMPPLFTRIFADRLNAQSPLRVREGAAGERLQRGDVWIAPGDFHMAVIRDVVGAVLQVHQGPPENSCRPAVDVLFRSVASVFGAG